MLVVKVELHPAGGGPIKKLGEVHIVNDGSGTDELGNYDVTAYSDGEAPRIGRVNRYRRNAGLSVLYLVGLAMRSVCYMPRSE